MDPLTYLSNPPPASPTLSLTTNPTYKRKAVDFEPAFENSSKKLFKSQPGPQAEEDITIQELDALIEKLTEDLKSQEEAPLELTMVSEALELISIKTGLSKHDKNSADISLISSQLEKEKENLKSFELEISRKAEEVAKSSENDHQIFCHAESQLKELIKALELEDYNERMDQKAKERYLEIFDMLGIKINETNAGFEAITSTDTLTIENAGAKQYLLRSQSTNFLYNGSQLIYPPELSYSLFKLLLKHK